MAFENVKVGAADSAAARLHQHFAIGQLEHALAPAAEYLPAAQLGQTDGAVPAVRLVAQVRLACAELSERTGEVAVPLEGVHREVEVGVEDEGN